MRNWVSTLVCLQLSELVILINLSEGSEGLIILILLYLGDFFHHLDVSVFIFALIDCLIAEMLTGSWRQRNIGRLFSGLDPNSTASLARMSALSLPVESICSATHVKDSVVPLFAFASPC